MKIKNFLFIVLFFKANLFSREIDTNFSSTLLGKTTGTRKAETGIVAATQNIPKMAPGKPAPTRVPATTPLYQSATKLLNFLNLLDNQYFPDSIKNFLNQKDIDFFNLTMDELAGINWHIASEQISGYTQAFNTYQTSLKTLRKQREDALKKILDGNQDANIIAKLIAPEELQKLIENTKISQYSVKPSAIKQFFTDQKQVSDSFKQQETTIKNSFLSEQQKLSAFNQLYAIVTNLINYLKKRTNNTTIQKGLTNLQEKALFDTELWKGLASFIAQIFVEQIAAAYMQGSK